MRMSLTDSDSGAASGTGVEARTKDLYPYSPLLGERDLDRERERDREEERDRSLLLLSLLSRPLASPDKPKKLSLDELSGPKAANVEAAGKGSAGSAGSRAKAQVPSGPKVVEDGGKAEE